MESRPEVTGVNPVHRDDLSIHNLLAFLRALRKLGFALGPDEEHLVLAAISQVGLESPAVCRDAVAAVVVRQPQQKELFELAWQQFWLWLKSSKDPWLAQNTLMANVMNRRSEKHRRPDVIWMGRRDTPEQGHADESDPFEVVLKGASSRQEMLRTKDFGQMTPVELEEVKRWQFTMPPLQKRTRREQVSRTGRTFDLQATLRRGMTRGEYFEIARRRTLVKPRPVVIICDVSGSMDPYSRMLLRFAYAMAMAGTPVETFVFSTRLTRITKALQAKDADSALASVSSAVPDFSGGTRLAEAMADFNMNFAKQALRHHALTLIASDGLDTGNLERLESEMVRLGRLSHRIVWLNPLLGDPGYQPIARGVKVLESCVDEVFPAHNWASLQRVWRHLEHHHSRREVRRQKMEV